MSSTETAAALSADPLDVAGVLARAGSDDVGGIAVFVGTVRSSPAVESSAGKSVLSLFYDAHVELAIERLQTIANEAARKWALERVEAVHRVGGCSLGEPTVVVCCAAAHRGDALEACRWVIDEIKGTVPIFKREDYADGSSWVGAEHSDH